MNKLKEIQISLNYKLQEECSHPQTLESMSGQEEIENEVGDDLPCTSI